MAFVKKIAAVVLRLINFLSRSGKHSSDNDSDDLDEFAKSCGYVDYTEMIITEEENRKDHD